MPSTVFNSLTLNHNLSFVHYDIQSILPKTDLLYAELIEFDTLAFSETWLHPAIIDIDDLIFEHYQVQERKDRARDNHGGMIIYVKEGIV